MTNEEWMKEAGILLSLYGSACFLSRSHEEKSAARDAVMAHLSARPLPQATLSEEDVLRAIQSCGRDLQGKISLTYDSGPYEVTKPTQVAMRFARAVLAAARQVPVGWKLVPVEPTVGMLVWMLDHGVDNLSDDDRERLVRKARARYVAMLAASPSPVGQEEPGHKCGEGVGIVGVIASDRGRAE